VVQHIFCQIHVCMYHPKYIHRKQGIFTDSKTILYSWKHGWIQVHMHLSCWNLNKKMCVSAHAHTFVSYMYKYRVKSFTYFYPSNIWNIEFNVKYYLYMAISLYEQKMHVILFIWKGTVSNIWRISRIFINLKKEWH
jgi:hypothetical protein